MEIYDTEEEQVEALKKWWKENSTSTIVGIIMGLAIVMGWNYWLDHKKAQMLQASAHYANLLKALDKNDDATVDKLAGQIQEQFKTNDYAVYSGLFQAKLKAKQGDFDAAKQLLKTIAALPNKPLGNIARIRLVRLMLATGEYEQGLQLINEVDQAETANYSNIYDELTGDLYLAMDRIDEARTSYQNAARNRQPSPLLQLKINDLTPKEKPVNQK